MICLSVSVTTSPKRKERQREIKSRIKSFYWIDEEGPPEFVVLREWQFWSKKKRADRVVKVGRLPSCVAGVPLLYRSPVLC